MKDEKKDSLDSLFASSSSDEGNLNKIKNDTDKDNKKHTKLQHVPNNDNKFKNQKIVSKKRKINEVLKDQTNENNISYNFTSKYAYEFEEDYKKAKREKINKDGTYMFLYKYSGQMEQDRKGKVKKARDPNEPKKYKTAFFQFLHEERDKAKKKFSECKNNKELLKKLGEVWKNMSDDNKKKYVEMEKKDKEQYDIVLKEYNENRQK